jgi:hypothetical protein
MDVAIETELSMQVGMKTVSGEGVVDDWICS